MFCFSRPLFPGSQIPALINYIYKLGIIQKQCIDLDIFLAYYALSVSYNKFIFGKFFFVKQNIDTAMHCKRWTTNSAMLSVQ